MKPQRVNHEMLDEVLRGLKTPSKSISSKYFYDARGCELFQQITELEEYYLTRSEREILQWIGEPLQDHLGQENIDLIEIGPGDGSKGKLIVSQLLGGASQLNYFGVDICDRALDELKQHFSSLPRKVDPRLILGDYLNFSNLPLSKNERRKLICFFGSSIGNLTHEESAKFIREVSQSLSEGDFFLIGFDLKKDRNLMTRAYNDSKGVTREFNLNLLTRFNRELGATFDVSSFEHLEYFDESCGAMVSYLVSKKDQDVVIGGEVIRFCANERIHTESSFKYSHEDIQKLIDGSGLSIAESFFDSKKYFSCVLFQKNSRSLWSWVQGLKRRYTSEDGWEHYG